jgi:hypothetical protein
MSWRRSNGGHLDNDVSGVNEAVSFPHRLDDRHRHVDRQDRLAGKELVGATTTAAFDPESRRGQDQSNFIKIARFVKKNIL